MSVCEVDSAYVRQTVAGPTWGVSLMPVDRSVKAVTREMAHVQRRCQRKLGGRGSVRLKWRNEVGLANIDFSFAIR